MKFQKPCCMRRCPAGCRRRPGIEAQTLANVYLALEHNLEIVPVINKIDLPSAQPDHVKREIEDVIGIEAENAPLISAKNKVNIEAVLEEIVNKIPYPEGNEDAPLRALIFDSYYDNYKGVIAFVRIKDGKIKKDDEIRMMNTGREFVVTEVGYLRPDTLFQCDELVAGDVGYIAASIKT